MSGRENGLPAKWLPTPVQLLTRYFDYAISQRDKANDGYIINRNIAYSFQYCEYLEAGMTQRLPTSVLQTLHIRSYVLHSVTLVEAALEYLLRADCGYDKKRLMASDISDQWKMLSNIDLSDLLDQFDCLLPVRNRIHLSKNQDDEDSFFRDTSYNFFNATHRTLARDLLKAFVVSDLFPDNPDRQTILTKLESLS